MDGFVEVYGEGLRKAKIGRRQKKDRIRPYGPSGAFTYCKLKKRVRDLLSLTPREKEKRQIYCPI